MFFVTDFRETDFCSSEGQELNYSYQDHTKTITFLERNIYESHK